MNINTIHVCGRITKDIELKVLPSGQQIASFCIATNHSYTTKDKEKKESTEFHNIILFGKQAENASKYLGKGDEAYVQGRNQTRMYEKDGIKMYKTEIIADSIQFGAKSNPPKAGNTSVEYDLPTEDNDPSKVPF